MQLKQHMLCYYEFIGVYEEKETAKPTVGLILLVYGPKADP
jgi:hypothetical protein